VPDDQTGAVRRFQVKASQFVGRAPPVARKFLGYTLTGGAAAVVDAGGFQLLLMTGAPVLVCAALSFCAAAVVNFALTSKYVFASAFGWRRLWVFLVFALVGLVINASVTTVIASAFPVPPIVAKLCGIAIAFVFNFLLNLLVVFRTRDAASVV
jgi:putative flippase GtrA